MTLQAGVGSGWRASYIRVACTCVICGVVFLEKRSHADERKCCSRECGKAYRSNLMTGNQNHQYGRRRESRGKAYKGGRLIKKEHLK